MAGDLMAGEVMSDDAVVRRHLVVRGLVQGVGFRPFVHRVAAGLGLSGWVGNGPEGVSLEIEGPSAAVARFEAALVASPPPLARIDAVAGSWRPATGGRGFAIVESRVAGSGPVTLVAPDTAVCDDCLRELFDPADRRYRYPFITCTNCGPRFTITMRLPYDRGNTTMAGFPLCGPCRAQYDDPADRRFHAQPLACAACGPALSFFPGSAVGDAAPAAAQRVAACGPALSFSAGPVVGDAALAAAQQVLAGGGIVAVKGLGGYHLACDPRSSSAVARLRQRKRRPAKPFAVMVRDLAVAGRLAVVSDVEAAVLVAPSRPIVLLARRWSPDGPRSPHRTHEPHGPDETHGPGEVHEPHEPDRAGEPPGQGWPNWPGEVHEPHGPGWPNWPGEPHGPGWPNWPDEPHGPGEVHEPHGPGWPNWPGEPHGSGWPGKPHELGWPGEVHAPDAPAEAHDRGRLSRPDGLSELVAPDNLRLGVMLPYTPVHHLLLRPVPGSGVDAPDVLVMTSGNLTDEPLAYEDDDARQRLGAIADAWLIHDRPIHVPCDDSVVQAVDGVERPVRRSRGWAPLPLALPAGLSGDEVPPLLAVGGELKTTFCLAAGGRAWMSQHIGDTGSVETLAALERSAAQLGSVQGLRPEVWVADLHPGYHTRQWAERQAAPAAPLLVQHHHAHVAALMAEHGVPAGERIVGVAFDGTGYGTDGAVWGGEVLLAGYDAAERLAHLAYVPLPGGDATIRKPYRAALAHLWAAGLDWSDDLAPVRAAAPGELDVLRRQLERGTACVPTSSMGRLFDAVASLLDLPHVVSYEAQAAMRLEALAVAVSGHSPEYAFAVDGDTFSAAPVLAATVDDVRAGRWDARAIAAGFHQAVARVVADVATSAAARTGVDRIGLTGGVFQNALLLRLACAELAARGHEVLTHRLVPPNDGGLALGQAAVAAHRLGHSLGQDGS